ncbi:MAG: chemotaxis protein CheW [Polyangiaceae bacterium]
MRSDRFHADPQKSLVGFVVGDVHYALEIARVVQILNPQNTTLLPHMPDEVAGVFEFRGSVIVVIDLRVRFGLPHTLPSRKTKWVLIDAGGVPAALVVDAVTDVFGLNEQELRPAPPVSGGDRRGIIGVTTHAGRLTFLLEAVRFRPLADAAASLLQGVDTGSGGSIGPAPRASLGPKA